MYASTWNKSSLVFTIVHKVDGSFKRYKVRLVAKGYKGYIVYWETFFPIAKIDTINVLFSTTSNINYMLH